MKTEYVIIGNSVAGVNCIEGIREEDKEGNITVISEEELYNYSRPLISYYLSGRVAKDSLAFRSMDFYRDNRVKLLLNTRAERIDTGRKQVITDKGKIRFDKLLISTGGKPFIPEIEGLSEDIQGVFTFMTLSDAEHIKSYIEQNNIKKGVILGGGLIGIKCAEGLVEKDIQVSIIEMADRLLSTTLDKQGAELIEKALKEKKQCEVITQDTIRRIESKKNALFKVILSSGREIETSLLVVAVGVKPDIQVIKDTPIMYNKGIIVDEYMRTNISETYAAGDVAEGKDMITEKYSVIAIWPVAARQGKVAGMNMAGGNVIYDGLFPMNSIDIAGVPVISFGITNPLKVDRYEIIKRIDDNCYKKIVLERNRIVGCIFIGRIERSGIFLGLIRNKIEVSNFKDELLGDDFGLLVLPAEYRKHITVGEGIEV